MNRTLGNITCKETKLISYKTVFSDSDAWQWELLYDPTKEVVEMYFQQRQGIHTFE